MKFSLFSVILLASVMGSVMGSITACGDSSTPNNDPQGAAGAGSLLEIEHRNGQTFIVWPETGRDDKYHVYRHNKPITSANLDSATKLTGKWGPLDQNTSVNQYGNELAPKNFIIRDLGIPLSNKSGLFVHTTQPNQQGYGYYAVTSVEDDVENKEVVAGKYATVHPAIESVSTPHPVLVVSENDGKGRIYTQYMDYANWNPTLNGYAFNFAVALPQNYDASKAYPLRLTLHAYTGSHHYYTESQYDWPVVQIFADDPGASVGTIHTWWYGFAADHNYKTDGEIPRAGTIENFTEQRVIASINYLLKDSDINIDPDRVHAYGHSMGASGVVALGLRYPSIFAGVYASQPMMNYGLNPGFQDKFTTLWGERSSNLPIVNGGMNSSDIVEYGEGGSQPTGVWDWMNHFKQIERRSSDRFAYLMVDHGKADESVEWNTQGEPVARTFTQARIGFTATAIGEYGHSWMSFGSVNPRVFGILGGDEFGWRYPRTLSFPSIQNATGSGSLQPEQTGDDKHNINIEWATPINNFDESIVDSASRYEITFRSMEGDQLANITPRNTNAFSPSPGTRCSWNVIDNSTSDSIASGDVTADDYRLVTITGVPIISGDGARLSINCT